MHVISVSFALDTEMFLSGDCGNEVEYESLALSTVAKHNLSGKERNVSSRARTRSDRHTAHRAYGPPSPRIFEKLIRVEQKIECDDGSGKKMMLSLLRRP